MENPVEKFVELKKLIEDLRLKAHVQYLEGDCAKNLLWFPEFDIGWLPANPNGVYDAAYFDRFNEYRSKEVGKKINDFRVNFVKEHCKGIDGKDLIDFGCGSGQFIDAYDELHTGTVTYGYDVNLKTQDWLNSRSKFIDFFEPESPQWYCVTCWDSIEHLPTFWKVFENIQVGGYLFLTIPIFKDARHALKSKHFRPDEHYWYFTRFGLVMTMDLSGFDLIAESNQEEKIGREDVATFAFRRR